MAAIYLQSFLLSQDKMPQNPEHAHPIGLCSNTLISLYTTPVTYQCAGYTNSSITPQGYTEGHYGYSDSLWTFPLEMRLICSCCVVTYLNSS